MVPCYRFSFVLIVLFEISVQSYGQSGTTSLHGDRTVPYDTIARIPWNNEAILALSYANGGLSFGLVYKRQVAERRYFRLSLADISFSGTNNTPYYSNQFPTAHLNFSANLTMGVEWRFQLHRLVATYTGVDVLAGFRHYLYKRQDPSLPINSQFRQDYTITAGLAFNSGVIIRVHELINVGLNLSPDVYYSFTPWEYNTDTGEVFKGRSHSISTSFSSGTIQLFMIFRWQRKPFSLKRVKA